MKIELENILELIEEHFSNIVYKMKPPLKDADYNLLLLANRIVTLRDNLEVIDKDSMDIKISEIMKFMERAFNIPLLGHDTNDWILQSITHNTLVFNIYKKLSNLRSI